MSGRVRFNDESLEELIEPDDHIFEDDTVGPDVFHNALQEETSTPAPFGADVSG